MTSRRETLGLLAALGLVPGVALASMVGPEALIAEARALAGSPWRADRMTPVAPFADLDYDRARGIRPRDGAGGGLPLGGGLVADVLPPGPFLRERVGITLPGQATPLGFSTDLFTFDPRLFPGPVAADPARDAAMGFSGLRLRGPMNRPDRLDEILVLQGASYFRALPYQGRYGLSARGLGLGTGGAGPEEFPVTRHVAVWGVRDGAVDLGCLIDSPRATAALILRLTPGSAAHPATVMDCALHLFPRQDLPDAGIAPLTSMFLKNPLGPAWIDDFRPAVHDSDALILDTGAQERLWRALQNPEHPQTSTFDGTGLRGFGLIQGIDGFDAAQDASALYHRRPSGWVEPLGDWGVGAVHLLELPTMEEYHDTIVAFWRPEQPLAAGRAHRFDYRLHWLPAGARALPSAPLSLTPHRAAAGLAPGTRAGSRLYVVDFAAAPGQALPRTEDLTIEVAADPPGPYIEGVTFYPVDEVAGQLRVSFLLTPGEGLSHADLRLTLRHAGSGALAAPVWLARWSRRSDRRI